MVLIVNCGEKWVEILWLPAAAPHLIPSFYCETVGLVIRWSSTDSVQLRWVEWDSLSISVSVQPVRGRVVTNFINKSSSLESSNRLNPWARSIWEYREREREQFSVARFVIKPGWTCWAQWLGWNPGGRTWDCCHQLMGRTQTQTQLPGWFLSGQQLGTADQGHTR